MKKIIYLLVLLFLCSCYPKNYRHEITYRVTYPDTTWVNTYTFDGDVSGGYEIRVEGNKQGLTIHPFSDINFDSKTICVTPISDCEITVIDYKIYTYGVDIKEQK